MMVLFFNHFNTSEDVIAVLKDAGIDTTGLQIEVKRDLQSEDYNDGRHGGDAFPGTTVKIFMNGRLVLERFFGSPSEKYEY